jgi:hypothetical protein
MGQHAGCNHSCAHSWLLLFSACHAYMCVQVLGRVNGALGLMGLAGCLAILGVIIGRTNDVGHAFVVSQAGGCVA